MKKAVIIATLLISFCIVGCGQSSRSSEVTTTKEEAAVEEADTTVGTHETNGSEASTNPINDIEPSETSAPVDEQTTPSTDKVTKLVEGMFTLYTRDGENSVTFPSLGTIMGVKAGTLSGVPDAHNPTGTTGETLNSTYGTVSYEYDSGRFSSPEEYLAYKVPDEFFIEAYYSEGYEEGEVETTEINDYTVFSQSFAFTEYGKQMRFWHVALMTKAGKLLTMDLAEGDSAEYQDVQLENDWFRPMIEAMSEE